MNINNHKLKEVSNISYYLYFLFNKNKLVYPQDVHRPIPRGQTQAIALNY